ncbi:MAG: metallophosphoesterase, partial [Acidobacteria bacterium]|nr:metallophosphoesterase [Acidobacteriota bacterium]
TLYDYTFRPPHVPPDGAVSWAADSGVLCSDEILLAPDPYPSREAWCAARLTYTEERLAQAAADGDHLILINHWPLREDLLFLRRVPRFSIWCGSKQTEDWHTRFPVAAVVYGHLHIKGTHFRHGVRFEECSLGYPRDWHRDRGIAFYLRQILPEPDTWLNGTRPHDRFGPTPPGAG